MNAPSPRWSEEQSDEVDRLLTELQQHQVDSPARQTVRDRIVEVHLPLLHYLAKRFAGRTESLEDLVQVGAIGLLKAIERFDPSLGHRFATYAAPTITGEMKRHLRDNGWLVKVPRRAQELHTGVARVREELSHTLGREPTVSEIASRLDASPDEVAESLDVAKAQVAAPLDQLIDTADGPGFQSLIAEVEEGFDHVERRSVLSEAMASLTAQEREVIRLRFAEGKSQAEIGATIGVSQMQISRIITRSVAKMRERVDLEPSDV